MPDVNQGFGCIVIPESRPNCLAMHTAYHVARGYNVGPDFLPFFIASPRIAFEAKFLSFALLPKRPHASLLVTCHEDRRKTISTICKSSFVSTYSNKVRACVPRSEKPGKINRTARKLEFFWSFWNNGTAYVYCGMPEYRHEKERKIFPPRLNSAKIRQSHLSKQHGLLIIQVTF